MDSNNAPETLLEAVTYFADADADVALAFLAGLRWPGGVICPYCSGTAVTFMEKRRVWQCKECRKQFSVKVGTIFEDSAIGLDKWLPCLWLIANCKNGVSSYEVARALGATQKTGLFMLHRIRLAMQTKTFGKMSGEVEVDETYIGGKARFMHRAKRERVIKGTGGMGKVAVMGLLARHGANKTSTVRVSIVKNTRKADLQSGVRENVAARSTVYSDALLSYQSLEAEYIHGVIDHSERYVDGKIHTNGLENFWSLLRRSIKGTYDSVEPFHLFRYLDEQSFRFNNRKDVDGGRFVNVAQTAIGKRLTYKALTGADRPETC